MSLSTSWKKLEKGKTAVLEYWEGCEVSESMSVEVSRLIFYDFVTGYSGTKFYVLYDQPVAFW